MLKEFFFFFCSCHGHLGRSHLRPFLSDPFLSCDSAPTPHPHTQQEADRRADERRKAAELAAYHQAQAEEKRKREEAERLAGLIDGKRRLEREAAEEAAFQAYARDLIGETAHEGRAVKPLVLALGAANRHKFSKR